MVNKILKKLILFIERQLIKHYKVFDPIDDKNFIFRFNYSTSPYNLLLSDGTKIKKGESLLEIHLNNDNIVRLRNKPDMAWGSIMGKRLKYSLKKTAELIRRSYFKNDIRAIKGEITLIPSRSGKINIGFFKAMGFDVYLKNKKRNFNEFFENLFAWMLIYAYNPFSFFNKNLLKSRRFIVIISVDKFVKLNCQ